MTWDEAISAVGYRHIFRDFRYAIPDFRITKDKMPKVTYTTTGDSLRAKDPYEDLADCFVYGADWINKEIDKIINNVRKEEIMSKEIKRKDIPVNLGRYATDIDAFKYWTDAMVHPEYLIVPSYERIIFNNPATIILWRDGTKTVVKCGPNDVYDPEKGLAMCLLKKLCGNDGIIFHQTIRKMMKEYKGDADD